MNRAEATSAVYRLILEGHTKHEILEAIDDWRHTKCLRTPSPAIWKQAAQRFDEIALDTDRQRLGFIIAAMLDLYRQMVGIADYSGALRALQEVAKVQGVARTPMQQSGAKPPARTGESAEEGAEGEKDLRGLFELIHGTGTNAGA
jgi:hypothetical protein